jgi:hypothetical protein
LNYYTYCGNNPLFFVDPWGLIEVGLRAYAENNGAAVGWSDATKSASVTYNGKTFYIQSTSENNRNGKIYIDDSILNEQFGWNSPFEAFDKLRNDLEWYTKAKSLNSTEKALTKIFAQSETINSVSSQLSVPKSMIQAVMFRELISYGIDDIIADILVKTGKRSDSSTGLGQVTATTAMAAHNPDNITLADMWKLLQNPNENIKYLGYILLYETQKQNVDIYAEEDQTRINIFAGYNAGNNYLSNDGQRYGKATNSYYYEFERINKLGLW